MTEQKENEIMVMLKFIAMTVAIDTVLIVSAIFGWV